MKLKEVMEIVDGSVLSGEELLETDILSAYGCDLMSDVLAFVEHQCMLITGLINPQVVRTAEMMDMKAIVFVRGKEPDEDVVNLAREAGIAVITTKLPMYITCGKLYENGLYRTRQ